MHTYVLHLYKYMSKHVSRAKILKKESGASICERFGSISNALSASLSKKKSDAAPKSEEGRGRETTLYSN